MKNKKFVIIAGVAVCGISALVSLAFLSDSKSVFNTFKEKGNGSIELIESDWNEENAKNIYPEQKIAKNPQLRNTGNIDEYGYLQVAIPVKSVRTVSTADESIQEAKPTELFTYKVSEDWVLLDTESEEGYSIKVYGYKNSIPCGELTSPLFKEVNYTNVLQGELSDKSELDIKVQGIGIQSKNNDSMELAYKGV